MKKKLKNSDFAKAVGKYSIIRIDWKDWKKELPKNGQDIWVVICLEKGYYPVTGAYFDETFPASKDGRMPKTRFQSVKFTEYGIPDTFMGSKVSTWLCKQRNGTNQDVEEMFFVGCR